MASARIGIPHRTIATHAILKGSCRGFVMLSNSAIADMVRNVMSFLVPPSSNNCSIFSMSVFMVPPFLIHIGVWVRFIIPMEVWACQGG